MEIQFEGKINYIWDDYQTINLIDGDKSIDLVKKFRAIFDLYESEVSVSYIITEQKQTHIEIQENLIKQLVGGIRADYEEHHYSYSSFTFGTNYDTYLNIGGHDLLEELSNQVGKYIILKINIK